MARILIVEDESLIAMMLEDFVDALGHEVAGNVDSAEAGVEAVGQGAFDIAILDINLRDGMPCWPVADALADAGKSFILATGGEIETPPERHADQPCLSKPYTLEAVQEALDSAV